MMNHTPKKTIQETKRHRSHPTVSAVLADGSLVETLYEPEAKRTRFVLWRNGGWEFEDTVTTPEGVRLAPYSPYNNLLQNEVVLLPSEPHEYGSQEELRAQVQNFIHAYVDVSPLFEKIASYYVLLSWVYDAFNELPYLRLRADPGSGKTRFLLTVGALCYKPIFASGASSVSPLFRIMDAFRGTLIIDEGDFRASDEQAEVIKILNNGNARGFPVLRSEVTPRGEFNPKAFAVFGPKLVATRRNFQDWALETRCLTEQMGQRTMRPDVPITLPPQHKAQALDLRNKLLLFRMRTFHTCAATQIPPDPTIEPRLNQIFAPLLSVVSDPDERLQLRSLARSYNQDLIADRSYDVEAQVLDVIHELARAGQSRLTVKEITDKFVLRHAEDFERKITSKWIGGVIRKRLQLKTQKSNGVFVIAPEEHRKLERLYERYGIDAVTDGG